MRCFMIPLVWIYKLKPSCKETDPNHVFKLKLMWSHKQNQMINHIHNMQQGQQQMKLAGLTTILDGYKALLTMDLIFFLRN